MNCASVSFSGGKFSLTKDLYVNSGLIGPFDSTSDVNVFLEDSIGNLITPTGSALVGNDLTITANIPNPSGVALQRSNPAYGTSFRTFDTGWRAQNGWFDYTPPAYPAKYAQLDTTLGANQWYRLKTALTVNGVTNTQRFVDLSGVQGWAALNNLNLAVLDKLTGLMFTRVPASSGGGSANWINQITTTAPAYSVTINGNTYSDWYVAGFDELQKFWGNYAPSGNWVDPISGLTIMNTNYTRVCTADGNPNGSAISAISYSAGGASGGFWSSTNTNETTNYYFYVHDVKNLIS